MIFFIRSKFILSCFNNGFMVLGSAVFSFSVFCVLIRVKGLVSVFIVSIRVAGSYLYSSRLTYFEYLPKFFLVILTWSAN